MKRALAIALMSFATPVLVLAQSGYRGGYGWARGAPEVTISDRAVQLQATLFPDYYLTHSASRDLRWVRASDSALIAFWEQSGPPILDTLTQLSGIPWVETDLTIYLVRYFPSVGASNPLIIPIGGMKRNELIEAAPTGKEMHLNLIYQLAHRNLAQADWPADSLRLSIADHPLMQPGRFRRDNLAMLLALVTAQKIIGLDSTYNAYQSEFWKRRTPGREVLQEFLLSEWILTPDRPLAEWIAEEPVASRLVSVTRTPRRTSAGHQTRQREFVEGLPLKGRLGFSVRTNNSNQLVVDKIDLYRLAYACGLREGDVLRRVNGSRPRNHKDLIEKILARLDEGGATLEVSRDGQMETVILESLYLPALDDFEYWDEIEDSLFMFDSLMREDSATGGTDN